MKTEIILLILISTMAIATPFCDQATIAVQQVQDAFCLSARKGQPPRLEIALENIGSIDVPMVELVAANASGMKIFLLNDANSARAWKGITYGQNKRTFTLNPLLMDEAVWYDSFFARPRFSKESPECVQRIMLPKLIDCHSQQQLQSIGEGMGLRKFLQKNETALSFASNTTNESTEKKPQTITNYSTNENNTSSEETNSPTGSLIGVVSENASPIITFLFFSFLTLGFMLVGSFLKEKKSDKQEEKEEDFAAKLLPAPENKKEAQLETYDKNDIDDWIEQMK